MARMPARKKELNQARAASYIGKGIVPPDGGGPILQTLIVSPSVATVGTAFAGSVSGKTAGSTLTLTGAGAAGLSVNGAAITGTPTTAGVINVVETLAGATGSPKTNAARVTAAVVAPALATLALTAAAFTAGAAAGTVIGSITGKTAGSTIAVSDNRLAVSSDGSLLLVGVSASSAGTINATLTETLSGATGSPKDTLVSIAVSASLVPGYVLFVAGQSNSVVIGTENGVPTHLQGAMPDVLIWQPASNQFATYEAGVNSDTLFSDPPVTATARTPPCNFGPEAQFAKLWKRFNPGVPLYIVKVGKGSSALQVAARQGAIAVWDTGRANEMYATTKAARDAAFAAIAALGKTPTPVGTFWMQGEADATVQSTADNYLTAVRAFRDQWRAEIMGGAASPFVFGRISAAAAWTFGATVRAAQQAAGADANCAWFSTDGYATQGDGIHYTPASVARQGNDVYAAVFPVAPASFSDDFSLALSQLEAAYGWSRVDGVAGALSPQSGALQSTTSDQTGTAYTAPDTGSQAHFAQAKITGQSINALCVRLQNKDNYFSVRTYDGSSANVYQVVQKVAGATTVVGSYGAAAIGDTIRLEASGNTFVLKKNGTQIGTGAIPATLTSTKTGLLARFAAAFCDDFVSGPL